MEHPLPKNRRAPDLEIDQILAWADAHHARTGQWPQKDSGFILEAARDTWERVDAALRTGLRTLSPGSSLARLLAQYRGVRNRKALPPFTEEQILAWADAHNERTGRWPRGGDGPIVDAPDETWMAVEVALANGLRGLPGGNSLTRLLWEHRSARNKRLFRPLTEEQILAWADAHHERTGKWPGVDSKPIPEAPEETWCAINHALGHGTRGLPGGTTLARFLAERRGARNRLQPPPLTLDQILAWAEQHHERTGLWPTSESGRVLECPDEIWGTINVHLRDGGRGLPGGSSLSRLLAEERGRKRYSWRPELSIPEILKWAEAHRTRTGQWPIRRSGPVTEAPGETWSGIHDALGRGMRGLPGGYTLAGLLREQRGAADRRDRPSLTKALILDWADAHHARHGCWPRSESGEVEGASGEKWSAINAALIQGHRGLPGGLTLRRLLDAHRCLTETDPRPTTAKAPRPRREVQARPQSKSQPEGPPPIERDERLLSSSTRRPPDLEIEQILQWADAHYARTGTWPTKQTGFIVEAPRDKWQNVDNALRHGLRGLSRGSSLAKFLAEHRGARHLGELPPYTIEQILAWADAHFARTGEWPKVTSGAVVDAPGETWVAVNLALRRGGRGLSGGTTLPQLLAARRGVRNHMQPPPLTEAQILAWADLYHQRNRLWPTSLSGAVLDAPGETWGTLDTYLRLGKRGLPGGSSLARLLQEERGRKRSSWRPEFSVPEILAWADAYRAREGRWPAKVSGPIPESPGDTWAAVHQALRSGLRGLPGDTTLAALLETHRQRPNRRTRAAFTEEQILDWVDRYHGRTGDWPKIKSGPIPEAPGDTWSSVNRALVHGSRGLSGGSSLAELLATRRGVRNLRSVPPLTRERILHWADAHREQTGRWPATKSGAVLGAPGETWAAIDAALQLGNRSLPGGTSLARLLAEERPVWNRYTRPRLSDSLILTWADAYYERHGCWPQVNSGPVDDAAGETWVKLDAALKAGYRGLPGGMSLLRLLEEHRQPLLARRRRRFSRGDVLDPDVKQAAREGVPYNHRGEPLEIETILAWADAYYQRLGTWPNAYSGFVYEDSTERWQNIDQALRVGLRGLEPGSSLARLLAEERGVRNRKGLPPLTEAGILAWAIAHHDRTGEWPDGDSGPIFDAPGETWRAVEIALTRGQRGLPGGSSLARLHAAHRGILYHKDRPDLTEGQILTWADAYFARSGRWPLAVDGAIEESPGDTWTAVDRALKKGIRGLAGGSSLARLLGAERGAYYRVTFGPRRAKKATAVPIAVANPSP